MPNDTLRHGGNLEIVREHIRVDIIDRDSGLHIEYVNIRTRKLFNDQQRLVRRYGTGRAKRIRQRLDDLCAVGSLADMRVVPGNCEELRGDRSGQLSLRLDGPYRLVFEPANEPIPRSEDGGLIWLRITRVRIVEVVDYHGR